MSAQPLESSAHRHRRGEMFAEGYDRGVRVVSYSCAEPGCDAVLGPKPVLS